MLQREPTLHLNAGGCWLAIQPFPVAVVATEAGQPAPGPRCRASGCAGRGPRNSPLPLWCPWVCKPLLLFQRLAQECFSVVEGYSRASFDFALLVHFRSPRGEPQASICARFWALSSTASGT